MNTEPYDSFEPFVPPEDLEAANRRHDAELKAMGIGCGDRLTSGWRVHGFARRGMLTDKKIKAYEAAGYYSEAYRTARRELMEKKYSAFRSPKSALKSGNFVERDGRMIYAPR